MFKRIFLFLILTFVATPLSGCSFPGTSSSGSGAAILRSDDGGTTFSPKVTVDEKTNIASVESLSLLFDPMNADHILLGTKESGIFSSRNAGDSWQKIEYPPTKVYGLARDISPTERIYASGEWQGRGKLYRSDDNGKKWQEVYTEPSNGTVITALVASTRSAGVVYLGTSKGVIVKTNDAGATWSNAASLSGPVLSLSFNSGSGTLYALVSGKGVFRMKDGESTFEDITSAKTVVKKSENLNAGQLKTSSSLAKIVSIATDPSRPETVYAGTEKGGLFVSHDQGEGWATVPVIASSAEFPIRAIAVRPGNPNDILYSSALAVYRSVDGGSHWAVYQLEANRPVGLIQHDPKNTSRVYLGLRSF